MPKNRHRGDAEAYVRSLQNPEETITELKNHKVKSSGKPKKPIRRRRLQEKQHVGYGHPPTRSQFKPGQSGNPKGRPKGSRNLRHAIEQMLTDKITVREGDNVRRVTRLEAVLLKQLTQALKGDLRAIQAAYASASALGLLEERPQELVVGDLSAFTIDELQEFERLLVKASATIGTKSKLELGPITLTQLKIGNTYRPQSPSPVPVPTANSRQLTNDCKSVDSSLDERSLRFALLVCTENLNTHIVMMKSAKDCMRHDASGPLDRTRDWRILVQRSMCSHFVVQLNSITPTGLKSGKFCIAGIRGLAGGSSFTT